MIFLYVWRMRELRSIFFLKKERFTEIGFSRASCQRFLEVFEFINEQQNNSGYIKRRLAFRLKASFSKEADLLKDLTIFTEQYSHPAFDDAVRKLCRFYDLYYEGRPESTVIHLLCGRVSPIDAEIGLALRAEAPVA